jgi:urease accessory protein
MDHLLAMVAVGVWSVSALPANKAWWGPATFMASLVLSAMLGAISGTVPFIEHLISFSVVMFGAMLVFSRLKLPAAVGLSLVALAAAFHGLAHGAEAPETDFATYALGFLMTTALLHFGGVFAALGLRRFVPEKAPLVVAALGALCAGAGAYLLSQV